MEEQKLTVTQAAKRLGVSPPTVRRLIQERVLTAERAGLRKWVIPESGLDKYMTARRSEAIERPVSAPGDRRRPGDQRSTAVRKKKAGK